MSTGRIARLRITLAEIEPVAWRTVEVPTTITLLSLHRTIQAAMGWEDYHLWHFDVGEKRYGVPDPEWPDDRTLAAKNVKLSSLIERGVTSMLYVYDMGDDWRHLVAIEAVEPADDQASYPRFVAGERRCPPEDVGGTDGYYRFLEAISDPEHREHAAVTEWYGGGYDPDNMDEPIVRVRMAEIASRRTAGKAGYAKSHTRH